MKGKAALGCMVFVAWSLALVVQAEHKIVAVVLKNPNYQGAPVLKVNAHKVLSVPSDQATIQQTTPLVANADNQVATSYAENGDAPVPVMNEKPKKVIRYKLIRVSDEDLKKEAEAKKLKQLKDAEDDKIKKALYPCRDYSPVCARYKNIWNPGVAQCRDVWMQRNCRETCGLCKIPVGVYLACHDMWHCKKLATHSCVHDWVRKTCKSMCGGCDGSKGSKFARVGASSVFVGKKKSLVETKKEKEQDDKKVKTVHQAIKLQAKPIKVENPIPKESKDDDSKIDEKDDLENEQSGDNSDDKDNDDDDDDNEMEKQPADSDMESESGDDEDTKEDKPEPEPKHAAKPAKHASVPKVTKKPEQKIVVQKPVVPKVHHHKQKKIAKKVVHDKKPKAKEVQVVKKVDDKKPKNPVKALVTKHKKPAHVAHHKKSAKKAKKVKKVAKKN
ncbi:uncharacterized protein LOC116293550 [Actinia tenebrosa]|uniref:Uncharacterized protein LOC116293550 n=1 Tax=Actinia tenebrosa TaxID=6105 RepID=A0A6P8HW98_ACTTE|nr:uncharacterized protein LOC116293550 [Actinia tenebrosa]